MRRDKIRFKWGRAERWCYICKMKIYMLNTTQCFPRGIKQRILASVLTMTFSSLIDIFSYHFIVLLILFLKAYVEKEKKKLPKAIANKSFHKIFPLCNQELLQVLFLTRNNK